jgi:retinal dehydrogenase
MADVDVKYTQIFIDNEWHKAENGKTFPVINPSTGEEICQVEEATRVRIHAYTFDLVRHSLFSSIG